MASHQNTVVAREADQLEVALKSADLRVSEETRVWDVFVSRGYAAAVGAIAGIQGAEKIRLKQSAPGMTSIEVPMELADVLNAARSEEGDSKIIAILRQIAGRSAPTSGGTLGDDQKPVTKAYDPWLARDIVQGKYGPGDDRM